MRSVFTIYFRAVMTALSIPMLSVAGASPVDPVSRSGAGTTELVILHTNDLHSKLTGSAPESQYSPMTVNDDKTIGGFARIAAVIDQEKAKDPDALVLDAGDFMMGSIFHALESKSGFELPLMDEMGYNAVGLGNHEFDFGVETLSKIIKSSLSNHTIPPILLSNIEFSAESGTDDELESLYHQSVIRDYCIIERKGLRIGLFGILGYDAASVTPAVAPAKFTDPVKTAIRISKKLKKEEGVDIVICLSHSGVAKNRKGDWDGEDAEIARKAKDIDIIISGHSHTRLDKPLMVNGTPVVQTGCYGQNVGRLIIRYENGHVSVSSYNLIRIDDSVKGDEYIHNRIETRKKLIDREILNPLGLMYDQPVTDAAFELSCEEEKNVEESNMGPFLADAIRYYINHLSGDSADLSMIATGTIRDNMVTGKQTIPDIFRILPLGSGMDSIPGYPLAKIYVTGRELKNIIEVLLAAYPSNHSYYCFYSGIRVSINPEKGLLNKVQKIELGDEATGYRPVDLNRKNEEMYGIAANSYLLKFMGLIKKKSFGLIRVTPKDRNGLPVSDINTCIIDFNPYEQGIQEGKEWLGVYSFIKSFPDINSDNLPDIPEYYRNCPQRMIIIGR